MEALTYSPIVENFAEANEESVAKVVISQTDWENINTAISKAIETAIAPLRPVSPWYRPLEFLRRWGAIAILWTVPLALIALAASALYVAVARVEKQAKFEADTTNALKAINDHLSSLQLQQNTDALNHRAEAVTKLPEPSFLQNLPEVKSLLENANNHGVQIDPELIKAIRSRVVQAQDKSPQFWPVAAELINYNSAIKASIRDQSPLPLSLPNCTDSEPKPVRITRVIDSHNATFSRATYENCLFTLDSQQDNERINRFLTSSLPLITFKNCTIVYRGGPVNLITTWKNTPATFNLEGHPPMNTVLDGNALEFENCRYIFSISKAPPPSGEKITHALVAQSGPKLTLPWS